MLDPEGYELNKSYAAQDAAEFAPKIIAMMNWKRGQNVLDYGCGAGSTGFKFILPQIEKCLGTMYSVDVSEKMLSFAVKSYSHPRIHYSKGEILKRFPFEEVLFDNILSIHVFHFIPDIRKALFNFKNLMKPGARLGFTFYSKSWYFDSLQELGETKMWKPYMNNYQEYVAEWMNFKDGNGVETLAPLFHGAGFKTHHLEIQKREFHFEEIDTLLELYMSLNPFIDRIPQECLPLLKDDLRRLVTGYAGIPLNSKSVTCRHEIVIGVIEKPVRSA